MHDEIRDWHRQYRYWQNQRIRAVNALGTHIRMCLGWSRSMPEKERKAIEKTAAQIIKAGGQGTPFESLVSDSLKVMAPFEKQESVAEREMTKLAKQLPAWIEFGEPVRGFGASSLGVIVAEAGNLDNYASCSKLWKRLGLAVMEGVRQGGLTKAAGKEAWISHGYNPKRRSRMWNIGDALIKGNKNGKYREIYLKRKEHEIQTHEGMTKLHAHRRAQRYMEKQLLKDLWVSWRKTA